MHDTELCADESGCEQPARTQSLCGMHYRRQWTAGTLPPKIKSFRKGLHALGESNSNAERWCSGCRAFVEIYTDPKTRAPECVPKRRADLRTLKTGWLPDEYDLALVAQGNRCAVCRRPPDATGLHADHCHVTGATRKLLCSPCNRGLGHFKDDPDALEAAAAYLRESVLATR